MFVSPVIGLIFSIIGIAKTTGAEKKHIVAGSVGMTISALEVILMIFVAIPWIGTQVYIEQHFSQPVATHSHDVEINDEAWKQLELREKGYPEGYPEKPLEDFFHLTLEDDYAITRDDHSGFKNLGWVIKRNGKTVLDRNANGELTLEPRLQWIQGEDGDFAIYLTAFVDGQYRRVSNVIEYTHLPSDC